MWYLWIGADDDQFTFEAEGVLNGETAQAFAESMESAMRHPGCRGRVIRLSLAAVGQADYAGIQVLRRCRARARMRGMTLKICDLSPSVRRAIRSGADVAHQRRGD
jgi:anti-anti-sigma regulatory factor